MKQYLFCLNAWNQTSYQKRVALLAQLKHPTIYAHRAFAYIPRWVRQDLIRLLVPAKAA